MMKKQTQMPVNSRFAKINGCNQPVCTRFINHFKLVNSQPKINLLIVPNHPEEFFLCIFQFQMRIGIQCNPYI